MKTKTYILTLSRTFPKGHPREGEETDFAEKAKWGIDYYGIDERCLEAEKKLHTIRADYELWKKRIDEVNAGRAVLSVRQWLGAPRRAKQRELFRLDRDSGIGVERLEIIQFGPLFGLSITDAEGRRVTGELETLAENDGLSEEDWLAWFKDCDKSQPMAIIHVHEIREGFLRERCGSLARHYPKAEFRWRYGFLKLDPSDKSEIFKSE